MKKIILGISTAVITISLTSMVSASMLIPDSQQAKDRAKAPDKSPIIDDNWDLQRIDFIHYAKPNNPGKPIKRDKETCYKLLGVKWKNLSVDYVINPANPENMEEGFVASTIAASAEVWDAVTSAELLNDNYTIDYSVQYGVHDFKNAIVFDDYKDDRIIAVTSIWYTLRGREIVEFDMIFNTRFNWGNADIDQSLMDLQNIVTHELGHAVGLADIYSETCSAVTMYGYSQEGERDKRTLEQPDINGIYRIYGM